MRFPGDGSECTLSKVADDTKPEGPADTSEGCAAIQRDLNMPEKRADGDLMKFNAGKYEAQSLGKDNLMHQDRLGTNQLESNFAEITSGPWWGG